MTSTEPTPGDDGQPVSLRPAEPGDLPAVAELHLRARAAAYPLMPALVHSAVSVRAWVSGWDLTRREVWLAEQGDRLVGYAALTDVWLDDLYVDPAATGRGIGSMLLELAQARRPEGLGLWVFASNRPARRFYARHGFTEVEHTDGSGNEERAPDVRLDWPGR